MSEGNEPEVILPATSSNGLQRLATDMSQVIGSLTSRISLQGMPRDIEYSDLEQKDKETVDLMMEKLKPDIEAKAKALLTAEVRDRIVRRGDMIQLRVLLKRDKKLALKRKKGCIFLQFGTGDADDPIEEFLIAST